MKRGTRMYSAKWNISLDGARDDGEPSHFPRLVGRKFRIIIVAWISLAIYVQISHLRGGRFFRRPGTSPFRLISRIRGWSCLYRIIDVLSTRKTRHPIDIPSLPILRFAASANKRTSCEQNVARTGRGRTGRSTDRSRSARASRLFLLESCHCASWSRRRRASARPRRAVRVKKLAFRACGFLSHAPLLPFVALREEEKERERDLSFLLQKYGLWSQSRRVYARSQLSRPSRPSFSSRSNNNNHCLFAYISHRARHPFPSCSPDTAVRIKFPPRRAGSRAARREWRVGREIGRNSNEIDGDVTKYEEEVKSVHGLDETRPPEAAADFVSAGRAARRNLYYRSTCGISFAVFVCRPLFRRFLILLVNSPLTHRWLPGVRAPVYTFLSPLFFFSPFCFAHRYFSILFRSDLSWKAK